jgi:hypothetical protein
MFRRRPYLRIPAIFYIYIAVFAGMTGFAASHIDATPSKTAPVKIASR